MGPSSSSSPSLSPTKTTDDHGGGDSSGLTSTRGANEVVGNLSRDDLAGAPFDISTAKNDFRFQGGMAATLGFPFTPAQCKELERQALIYKYMLASVPVPLDLLLPRSTNLPPDLTPYHSPCNEPWFLLLQHSLIMTSLVFQYGFCFFRSL
ncbi:unnamed protein product [Ilex paraguariensis]|uniref:Growth-regulating factor n=1 Tax=Ilex paraguariensis TaxID=185542 RepID=A0ABC8R859_9AQUA